MKFNPFRSLFVNAGFAAVDRVKVADDEWQTRDGRVLKFCDMDDRHLKNTIALIERTAAADGSQPGEYVGYERLCAERDRRGLT